MLEDIITTIIILIVVIYVFNAMFIYILNDIKYELKELNKQIKNNK